MIKGLGPGGAETLLAAAADAHDAARIQLECAYVLPFKDHLVERLEGSGVVTHCLSRRRDDPLWALRLAQLIRSGGWDVVHVHSPLPGSVARIVVRTMRGARPHLVSTEHNAWGTFAPPTRWLNRATSRWDEATFAVSDETRHSMSGPAAVIARTLAHGIDVQAARNLGSERAAVRAELGLSESDVVIGTVANFRVQKDYPNFLAAARALLDRGVAARFVVVGQGPMEAEVRARAAELDLDDHVLFTGFRPDAVRVMSAFDVFTLASSWEGLPVVLMEALALGLPIVATKVGGVAETMLDGEDAVLVAPRDSAALADSWAAVIGDLDLRQRLAATGSRRADEFDVRRVNAEIEQVYERLVPGTEPTAATPPRSTRSTGLDIRPATPDDRTAIIELLRRSLGWSDDPRFIDLFRWKHELNAFGPSPAWVAVDNGRIVGVRLFMRWEFVRDGQLLRAVRAVDTATDPDYQGRGLFTALTLQALDEMRGDGVDFVFNTPNSQSRPGYLKMGWRVVGKLPAAVRVSGPRSMVKLARARVASEHWSQPIEVGEPFERWIDGRALPVAQDLPTRTLATNANDAFVRWRFSLAPMHYRVIEGDGGAVVVRARRRGPALELVQLRAFGLDQRHADRLTAAQLGTARADHAIRLGGADPVSGFVPLPGGGPIMTWRAVNSVGMPPLANWSLSMSDIELM